MTHASRRIGLASLAALTASAAADMTVLQAGGAKLDIAFTAGLGAFAVNNAQAGAGIYRPTVSGGAGSRVDGGPRWLELFVKPELKGSFDLGSSTLYATLSAVGAATRGDGDANYVSTTTARPESIKVEEALVGWRSGTSLGSLGEDAIDVSLGRQVFKIGDGLVVADGTSDIGRRAGYWSLARSAYDGMGVVKLNTAPVRADIFALRNDSDQKRGFTLDQASTTFWGGNVEWFASKDGEDGRILYDDRQWYVGAMALHVSEADTTGNFSFDATGSNATSVTNALSANRDGLNVFAARIGGNMVPMVEDLSLYGEFVYQRNGDDRRKVRAHAFYVEPGYQFSAVSWQPKLTYRYARFSGDGNPGDTTDRSYDPMFYGATRGYGTWYMGEITGQYFLFNSNAEVHMLGLSVYPSSALKLSAIAYHFGFDKKEQYGANVVRSDKVGNELNLITEYSVSDNISLAGVLGIFDAKGGTRDYLRNFAGVSAPERVDSNIHLGQVAVVVKF